MQLLDYVVLIGYFVAVLAIGVACSRRVQSQNDYFMGGRSFGKLVQTFAAFGAGTGANDPIQVGRTTWTSGMSGVWSVLMWLFATPFYWIFAVWYRRMRHMTLGDWFVERYESRALGAAYTVFGFAFYMMYLSTMFAAISKVAEPLLGQPALELLNIDNPEQLRYYLVPTIAVVVAGYGILGGLRAAYWTDLLQGFCIILLSVILIPCGLSQLVEKYGDRSRDSIADGFRIMHEQVPDDYFHLFTGPQAGEFPPHFIVALIVLGLVGIVVQPHFILTGGGSAKTESAARIGLVAGNFLKRFCTIGWALTGLIALALMADNASAAADPDRVWGLASREILGPLGMGLVGLMLACLLAALMSSADCYMIVSSALLVHNIYAPYINKTADDRTYLKAARIAGVLILVGASAVAMSSYNVFGQFKLALEVALVFAAPFWIGMVWRRATTAAAWTSIIAALLLFFVAPAALPMLAPSLRDDPRLATLTDRVTRITTRPASESDVRLREAHRRAWQARHDAIAQIDDPGEREKALGALGPQPEPLAVGQPLESRQITGGRPVFWSERAVLASEVEVESVQRVVTADDQTTVRTERIRGEFRGEGSLAVDFLIYRAMGIDLRGMSGASLAALRAPTRIVIPFVLMIVVSLFTRRNLAESLDRYYVKMKTPVDPDPRRDAQQLAASMADPTRLDHRKLFPGSQLEIQRPTRADVLGFVISVLICGAFVALASWVSGIGG